MSTDDIQPGQTWVIDHMHPEDAEGVCRLFLEVYGEGYPIRHFIVPDKLIAENRAKRVISSVARTPAGDIVGHNALYHSAPSPKIFESGAGLVHKHYRGGQGIFSQLGRHCIDTAAEMGADAVWGEPVTNHVFAQKSTHSLGWETFAVEVNLMPAAAYVKEGSAAGRVSTLMDFQIFNREPQRVYLPAVYEEQLKFMYGDLLELRRASTSDQAPRETESVVDLQYFDFAQLARLAVERIGTDFGPALATRQAEALERDALVLQVWLKLGDPAAGWAADILRSQGYFLGGPLPWWFDSDGLLMQKTLSPPDWERIQIAYERADLMLDMIKRDCAAVS